MAEPNTEADREAALNAGLNGQEPPAPPDPEPSEPATEEPAEPDEAAADTEDEPAGDEPNEEPAGRQPSRAERRIQTLAERTARAEAEAQLARETMERYRREAEQAAALQRQREDELLDPDERYRRQSESRIRNAEMAALDAGDRAQFYAKAAADPARSKYADRIEAELAKARASGQNASREGIYVYLRGQDAIAAEQKAGAARRKSAETVRQARGKPNSPTSNAQPSRSPSLEDRLKDIAL